MVNDDKLGNVELLELLSLPQARQMRTLTWLAAQTIVRYSELANVAVS